MRSTTPRDLRGHCPRCTLPLEICICAALPRVEARTTINRKDWNLNWNVALEAGGILVSEKIQLELDVQATKA